MHAAGRGGEGRGDCTAHKETHLERQNSRVNGVLDLDVLVVALLQERLGVDHVLPYCRRLPRPVRA